MREVVIQIYPEVYQSKSPSDADTIIGPLPTHKSVVEELFITLELEVAIVPWS
jgi:hypothetical protein